MASLRDEREGCYAPLGVNVEERTAAVFSVVVVVSERRKAIIAYNFVVCGPIHKKISSAES